MKLFNFNRFALVFSVFLLSISVVYAQKKSADNKLIDDFIASKGYASTIVFDASNIKQFWTDRTVMAKDGEIVVLLSHNNQKYASSFQKIQLANVDQTLDCKIDIITTDPDLSFSIADKSSNVLSTSVSKEDFIQFYIISSSFHLEDTAGFSFSLKFFSNALNTANIKKIVLSFSGNKNTSYLTSPGVLQMGTDDVTAWRTIKKDTDDKNSFFITGKDSRILSTKKIIVTDNILKNSVTIKNTGDKPTHVYVAYAPYTKDGRLIDRTANPYQNNNQILKVLSHEKNSKKIVVDSFPKEWGKGCCLALNAKEDLSDFPNTNLVEGRIEEINKISDDSVEIVFDQEIKTSIESGSLVRIQSPNGSMYMYPAHKVLEAGEEIKLSSTVQKDDTCYEFSPDVICRGTYYIVPIILSFSVNSSDENTILISDFTVSY